MIGLLVFAAVAGVVYFGVWLPVKWGMEDERKEADKISRQQNGRY